MALLIPFEGHVDHTSMGKLGQDTCLDTDGQKEEKYDDDDDDDDDDDEYCDGDNYDDYCDDDEDDDA